MSFDYEIVDGVDDERILNCDEVEALDNLDVIADQLRQDAAHLESRFPADSDGSGVLARPICADVAEAQPAKSHVEKQMQLCLTQVEAVLENKQKRQENQLKWFRGLTAGISLAIIIAAGFAVGHGWSERQLPTVPESAAGLALSDDVRSLTLRPRPHGIVSHAEFASSIDGIGLADANPNQIQSGMKPTPVSFEIPRQFLHASGPEMEGLLDLFESDSTDAVMIEF